MKVAFIQPINNLSYDNTNYHMCLTHLVLEYPHYAEFYKNKSTIGDYVILDNSLVELGKSLTLSDVLYAANLISPNEIILPDCFLDKDKTINEIHKSLPKLKNTPYKLQAVCHGKNDISWKECWDEFQNIDEIDCVGIPKVTTKLFDNGRPEAVRYALNNNRNNKQLHLLGIWEDVKELKEYSENENLKIRGVDSSIVFHSTIENYSYKNNQTKKPNYKIDLTTAYNIDDKLLLENQKQILDWV
tara:strand:+ start:407 stop:1138 length:732 start_codon:yes stop_codon:yes gene_type:complete